MIVAVASGKGGTGKTTVAASLASVWDGAVVGVDLDVEEPNLAWTRIEEEPASAGSGKRRFYFLVEAVSADARFCSFKKHKFKSNLRRIP